MRKILLVLLMVAFVALPAYASVQNIKVSGDIDSLWVIRDSFDLGRNTINTDSDSSGQNFAATITRLRVDADLSDNVSAVVALINERAWGAEEVAGTEDNDLDLNLAYVTLREMLYSPLTVQIGRQVLHYGNGFVIGAGGPNNAIAEGGLNGVADDLSKRTAVDAVKAVLDYDPLTVDLVYAKINENSISQGISGSATDQEDDVDLYGINANYQLGDDMDTVVEGYFFAKVDDAIKGTVANGPKADKVFVPGIRVSTNPLSGLNLQAEIAMQKGTRATTSSTGASRADNLKRDALGGMVIANYALPFEKTAQYNPVTSAAYIFVSGDQNPTEARDTIQPASEEKYTAWDPMFENQSGGKIYNSLFQLTNSHIFEVALTANPLEDVTAKLTYTKMLLDKKIDIRNAGQGVSGLRAFSMLQPDGAAIQPHVSSSKDVGEEIDLDVTYDYTEDVTLSVSGGIFIPGKFFEAINDDVASQVISGISVAF